MFVSISVQTGKKIFGITNQQGGPNKHWGRGGWKKIQKPTSEGDIHLALKSNFLT